MISRRGFLAGAVGSTAAAIAASGCRTRQVLQGDGSPVRPESSTVISPTGPSSVVMIGDSITVGAQQPLEVMFTRLGFSPVTVNAQKSRRIDIGRGKYEPRAGTAVAEYVVGSKALPELWVIALGTNDAGLYREADEYRTVIAHMLAIIPPTAPLAWIDIYRRDFLAGSQLLNVVLRDMLAKRGHAVVGDWYQQCTKPDARILSGDGVHPNKRGFGVFTDTVRAAALSLVS